MAHKIALVGIGQIAREQHIPAIGRHDSFELAATVSRASQLPGIPNFATLDAMLSARPDITTVSLCNPPQVRFGSAMEALAAGRHVMMEKPPGATVSEVHDLMARAEQARLTLFATWHSRFSTAVPLAKAWLATQKIRALTITWKEDVRFFHPGQKWIWQAGGFGIFDPGINALSVLTEIMPFGMYIRSAVLDFPSNCDTPIGARLHFNDTAGPAMTAEFDWRFQGDPLWNIAIETEGGSMLLSNGGRTLVINGALLADEPKTGLSGLDLEYTGLYDRFAELLARGGLEVDLRPLSLVADCFMVGQRVQVEPFID
jgi:D-galactose 1-dehydrogenase